MDESILETIQKAFIENPGIGIELGLIVSNNHTTDLVTTYLANHSILELCQNLQSAINWRYISFKYKFIISKFIAFIIYDKSQSIKLVADLYSEVYLLVNKTNDINYEFSEISKLNRNHDIGLLEHYAHKNFINFINLILHEAKFESLKTILNDNCKVLYFKYFKNIFSTDLYSIFKFNYNNEPIENRWKFSFGYIDFVTVLERFNLAEQLLIFLIGNLQDLVDDKNLSVIYRIVIRLLRIDSSLSLELIFNLLNISPVDETIANLHSLKIDGLELQFKRAYLSSMIENKVMKDIPFFLKSLQKKTNPRCVFHTLKKISNFSQLISLYDEEFCWRLALYFAQYTCKHFKKHSSYFIQSLKTLIKMFLSLNMATKILAEQALGLAEMVYFSPSKTLASMNLWLSISICHDLNISQAGQISVENYTAILKYAQKSYEFSKNLEKPDKTKLKSLIWLLQIIQKHGPDGKLTSEFRDYFNEACLLISNFEKKNDHLYKLYRTQLAFIDVMTTAIFKKNFLDLSSAHLRLLKSYASIEQNDTLIERKMKVFCRNSPMVTFYVEAVAFDNIPRSFNAIGDEIDFHRLRKEPETNFFYDYKLWSRIQKDRLNNSSGTEDSESDSLSDTSSIEELIEQ